MLLFYEGCHVSCGVHWRQGRKKTQYMTKVYGQSGGIPEIKGPGTKEIIHLGNFLRMQLSHLFIY
jgi:hypothetical protein